MSETTWSPEVAVALKDEEREAQEEPGALAVSVDDFSALEERVRRAVDVVRRERQERVTAELRASNAEAKVLAQAAHVESLQNEVNMMRTEREQVKERVDHLLRQLDALDL